MTGRIPRTQAEALATALGVSVERARQIQKEGNIRDPRLAAIQAYEDAERAADHMAAQVEAWQKVSAADIADAATSPDPEAVLRDIVADDTERIFRDTRIDRGERRLRASIAAHESWAKTEDRAQRLAPARQAFAESFERKVDPDGILHPAERAKRAENARKAYYQRLALKSAQARRRKREAAAERP